MSPVIRLAQNSDIEAIASLVAQYWEFEDIVGFDRPRVNSLLADLINQPQRGHCWVAEICDDLVGYLLIVLVFSLEHGGMMAEIDELFVVPEKRSTRIGSTLLDEASQALASAGIAQLQLQLAINNTRGKHFYEAHGFRMSGNTLWQKSLTP